MNKRGLSGVITTLIIIVLVIAAIGIIWAVVRPYIEGNTDEISMGKFTISLELENVAFEENGNSSTIGVKRNKGEASLSGIKFIFSNGTSSESFDETTTLVEFGKKSFDFNLVMDVSDITEISIAPILISDSGVESVSDIIDKHVIRGNEFSCTAFTCVTSDYECGTGYDDGCDDTFDCGDCSSGVCTEGVCVV